VYWTDKISDEDVLTKLEPVLEHKRRKWTRNYDTTAVPKKHYSGHHVATEEEEGPGTLGEARARNGDSRIRGGVI